jgi:IS1 family transposase
MSVEGVSKAAIARIKGVSWNTVARWLERAAAHAARFNDLMTRGYELKEIQADEIRTFAGCKKRATWVLATIEVWSRLWPSTVVGRRSYRNTRRLITDTAHRGRFDRSPLLTTDGFKYYTPVIARIFSYACVYGQVMKTYRNGRVHKVERRAIIGSPWQLEEALECSEDSRRLNTSFVERLNLTIRQGSAYLNRKSPAHARMTDYLEGHLELLRCYYNFVRPHRALKYGREIWTPAMQAGLASRKLSFRDIFTCIPESSFFVLVVIRLVCRCGRTGSGRMAA